MPSPLPSLTRACVDEQIHPWLLATASSCVSAPALRCLVPLCSMPQCCMSLLAPVCPAWESCPGISVPRCVCGECRGSTYGTQGPRPAQYSTHALCLVHSRGCDSLKGFPHMISPGCLAVLVPGLGAQCVLKPHLPDPLWQLVACSRVGRPSSA